jgi:hypothetical protein
MAQTSISCFPCAKAATLTAASWVQVTVCRQKMTSKAFVPSNHKDLGYIELASAHLGSARLTADFTSCSVDTK